MVFKLITKKNTINNQEIIYIIIDCFLKLCNTESRIVTEMLIFLIK